MTIHAIQCISKSFEISEKLSRVSSNISKDKQEKKIIKIINNLDIAYQIIIKNRYLHPVVKVDLKDRIIQKLEFIIYEAIELNNTKMLKQARALSLKINEIFFNPKKQRKSKPKVNIGFFLDFHSHDHNGAIAFDLRKYIEQKIPFITTLSLLKATGVSGELSYKNFVELEKIFLPEHSNWEIYQLGNRLFVFLPKCLFPKKTGIEKLRALDFETNGTLKKVSFLDILQLEETSITKIDELFKLFVKKPNTDKFFTLYGHGGAGIIGGLDLNSYKKFVRFLQHQRCQGLVIHSCSSGGQNSLLNLIFSKTDDPVSRPFSFPFLLSSKGDFSNYTHQEAEQDVSRFLKKYQNFNKGTQSVSRLRNTIEDIEEKKEKVYMNGYMVKFPTSRFIPSGFRPVNEGSKSFVITFVVAKQMELMSKRLFRKDKKEIKAKIHFKKFLEVLPMITSSPIVFKDSDPILISLTPGNGQHLFKSIELSQSTALEFIEKTILFHAQTLKSSAKKAFLIGNLVDKDKRLIEELLIYGFKDYSLAIYKSESCYFMTTDGKTVQKLSDCEYMCIFHEISQETTPRNLSLWVSSVGQETVSDFRVALKEFFWSKESKSALSYKACFDAFSASTITSNQIKVFLEFLPKESEEVKKSMLFFLLKIKRISLAFEVFKDCNLSPDIKNFRQIPLIHILVEIGFYDFIEHLIRAGADVNASHPLKNQCSPLHTAVCAKYSTIVSLLVKAPNIQIDITDLLGYTPLSYSMDAETFQILTCEGAEVDALNLQNQSILGDWVSYNQPERVERMLAASPDIEGGTLSPLVSAVRANNLKLAEMLINHGAYPFKRDKGGKVPFIEACLKGYFPIVDLMLKHTNCKLDVEDSNGLTPAFGAIFSGNKRVIKALQLRGAPLKLAGNSNRIKIFNDVLIRLKTLGNTRGYFDIIKWSIQK